jgi:hypothetical protein
MKSNESILDKLQGYELVMEDLKKLQPMQNDGESPIMPKEIADKTI